MRLIPVVIESPVQCAGNKGPVTALSAVLGTSTLREHLTRQLKPITTEEIFLIPGIDREGDALVELTRFAHTLEAGDQFIVIDPARWPGGGYQFRQMTDVLKGYRGITHVVAVGSDDGGVREQVLCDVDGRVCRVERLYNCMTWPEVAANATVYSIVPAKRLIDMTFDSLASLRSSLAARGGISRDLPLQVNVHDLHDEEGFLSFSEQALLSEMSGERPSNYHRHAEDIWIGSGCHIDASVRLVPPIMMQPGCRVEPGVTIIGPSVIGADCVLERGATVAQSVLMSETVIAAGTVLRSRVVAGTCDARHAEANRSQSSPTALKPIVSNIKPDDNKTVRSSDRRLQRKMKRLADIVLSATALIILSPLLLIVAIAIRLDSKGWPFFTHQREGRGGKEFPCIKFRTMISDAHKLQRQLYEENQVDGPQFKLVHDPRLTRLGHFLRASNIDELPQLINVLLGHMSLVGPRPSPFRENQICVPWRRARLSVRPGITGLWQLCRARDRSEGDFHEWIYYDINYVRHFSMLLDLKILLMTALTFGGKRHVSLAWFVRGADHDYQAEILPASTEAIR